MRNRPKNRLTNYFVAAVTMTALLCLVLVSAPNAQNAPAAGSATATKSAKADVKPWTLCPRQNWPTATPISAASTTIPIVSAAISMTSRAAHT